MDRPDIPNDDEISEIMGNLERSAPWAFKYMVALKRMVRSDDQLPKEFRRKCIFCGDRGVESYLDPLFPEGGQWARPCAHCRGGEVMREEWVATGIWNSVPMIEVNRIMGLSCVHGAHP